MCRLVVRARDSFGPDQRRHHRGHRRGHIIAVLKNGQFAGKMVEGNPLWRIIECPSAECERFFYLMECEDATPGSDAQKKKFILDLDTLERDARAAKRAELSAADTITVLTPVTIDNLVTVSRRGQRFTV